MVFIHRPSLWLGQGKYQFPPLYAMPNAANLRYRFDASWGTWLDQGQTQPALVDGTPLPNWENGALAVDNGVQTTVARQPILRLGGVNGRPYLQCRQADQQFFNNLVEGGQPGGILNFNPFTIMAVVSSPALLTSTLFGHTGGSFRKGTVEVFNNAGTLSYRWFKTQVNRPLSNGTNAINIFTAVKTNSGAGNFAHARNTLNSTNLTQNSNATDFSSPGMGFLRAGTATNCADLDVYEVFYWNTNIGAASINSAMNTLRTRYGLPTV